MYEEHVSISTWEIRVGSWTQNVTRLTVTRELTVAAKNEYKLFGLEVCAHSMTSFILFVLFSSSGRVV
jgi:hypothetical protein